MYIKIENKKVEVRSSFHMVILRKFKTGFAVHQRSPTFDIVSGRSIIK